ncbi:MAG: ribbon-helix-helix protein, CopG family [Deltaproteobacteria bacterium]|nr:MAG: ribbon-helix-helix protein, CopG family [Deltaproteobacteria bacterium]
MRTTLSLDEDVDKLLRQICRQRGCSFKQLVNEALRLGLARMSGENRRKKRPSFDIEPVSLGKPYLENIDNVADVLAVTEGENYR